MSDRRREERVEVCLDAVWDGRSGRVTARVTDLSEGGCYVDTLGEAYIGEILNIKLPLPAGDWLELTGEVAHHSPPMGFGVRFVNLSEQQREKLDSLLAKSELSRG
ncbi:MAG TPA: PilZ domain-containing protein [Pyrinomonadaceae bacterium]|nr:PilZ domain-containing protein [Pyrinomonadaceae bacterium]